MLRLYITDIFTSGIFRYSNTSEILFAALTYWNISTSATSLLLVVELPSLAYLLSSSGLDSTLRSLFLSVCLSVSICLSLSLSLFVSLSLSLSLYHFDIIQCQLPQKLKNLISRPRQTKTPDNSNVLHMFNNNTYTDFRTAYKYILIPSYFIQVV